jgi:hypothetical protein
VKRSVAAVLAAVLALVPAGTARAAHTGGLDLVVDTLAAMLPGQQGWVSAMWSANLDVCDVRMTVTGSGLTIGYPANTATYTSFYTASALAQSNMDYVAVNVSVPATATSAVTLSFTVSYLQLPPGLIKKDDNLKTKKVDCKGPKGSETVSATLPVIPPTGAAVLLKTSAVSVPRATPTWTNLTFRGTRPNLANFRVTVTPPTGLKVVYPNDGASSGLSAGGTLPVGADDSAAVRLDASGLSPGTYQVPVHATYTGGSFDGTLNLTVT